MPKINWKDITREDVIKAIEIFQAENSEYPSPKNTFLIYNGKKLPAKHIRGMAYKVAYGNEISKNDFSGGMETVRFFERLGFEMFYSGTSERVDTKSGVKQKQSNQKAVKKVEKAKLKLIHSGKQVLADMNVQSKVAKDNEVQSKDGLKIALYLQTDELRNKTDFAKAIKVAKKSNFDIFVLPEVSYCPFNPILLDGNSDICMEEDVNNIIDACLDFSKEIGKAVIVSSGDKYGTIYSVFANAFANETETICALYIKHTMTTFSAFDFKDYHELSRLMFEPILYKGYKIGMTICYDCNHSLFSRMYGLRGVDIIINSTGGDVIYDKWYKYNKVRAIENSCFNFVTMGGDGKVSNPHSYVYGFNPNGKELMPQNIMKKTTELNSPGGIYVYDTSLDDGSASQDTSFNQLKTSNKNSHIRIPVGGVDGILSKAEKIAEGIFVYKIRDINVVFCLIEGNDILKPEKVLPLLYAKELNKIENKRYIIINKHKHIEDEFYKNKLSVVLKVRSMENFCAVIVESDNINNCYQCGKNRTAQVLKSENGRYGIDLDRTTGPEAIWKNKDGMKASWRENFEWLIHEMGNYS